SSLTGLSVALGVMLTVTVLVIYSIVRDAFEQRSVGYDLVIGRRGSDLQLVLSTVYRIGDPPANLPYSYYRRLIEKDLPFPEVHHVTAAVPIALGDYTEQGTFPIVGTTGDYFKMPFAPKRQFRIRGHVFEQPFDAIIGSRVAQENNWNLGSQFTLVHGGAEGHHHDEKFTVVGVLERTGTANDRTVFTHLNGFYAIAGHETPPHEALQRESDFYGREVDREEYDRLKAEWERLQSRGGHHHGPMEEFQKELSAIFVSMRSQTSSVIFSGKTRKSGPAMAVNPIEPIRELMENFVGPVSNLLVVLTALVVVVSGVGIFVSIYNSMSDRRREIAVMRALGAQRRHISWIVLTESILLCVGGGLLGVILGHGLIFAAAPAVSERLNLIIDPLTFHLAEFLLIPGLIVLASLVGFLPALSAYRTDVARTLAE
ncbi:MAG: ABC transporter permease, partial [Planctomycetes bacterium]|nr:ABC transporter permease [Planctomycetota bacterium]